MPDGPATDSDRQLTVELVQRAMAAEAVSFEEIDDRFAAVYRAETKAELAEVVADLPQPPAPVPAVRGHILPRAETSIIGDIKVGGWIDVEGDLQYTALLGDLVIDLSSADLPSELRITCNSIVGDTTIILPDGVRTSVETTCIIGDRKSDLAPALASGPTVRITGRSLVGDVKVYSLSRVPEGKFRKLWKALRSGQ